MLIRASRSIRPRIVRAPTVIHTLRTAPLGCAGISAGTAYSGRTRRLLSVTPTAPRSLRNERPSMAASSDAPAIGRRERTSFVVWLSQRPQHVDGAARRGRPGRRFNAFVNGFSSRM